jgi:DHA2 family multidrug resistance protein
MATTTLSAPMSAPRSISPWLLAATVPLASFMEFLDTTIVNVAVEHIAGDLSSTIDESTYVLTSYLVANVIVLPLSGYLSGLLGRKNYYLWSVAIFTIASLLCGFAPSLYWLVFFRVLQGLGGGGLQPVSQAIIMDAFPPEKRSTAQAVFSITAVIAPAIGPLLGGWITDNYSWRWIFFIKPGSLLLSREEV